MKRTVMEEDHQDQNQPVLSVSYRELFEMFISFPEKNLDSKFHRLRARILELTGFTDLSSEAKNILNGFYYKFKIKWSSCNRTKDRFLQSFGEWLHTVVELKKKCKISKGRKSLDFDSCSERTKRQKTKILRENFPPQQLAYAAQMSYRVEQEVEASKLIKSICEEPRKAKEYSDALKGQNYSQLSSDEALSLMVEARLTKFQYKLIRKQVQDKNCYVYPSYDHVFEAKKRCYPDNIRITESSAEVPVQSLLNHTSQRLLLSQKNVLLNVDSTNNDILKLTLACKYGFDGSSGQSEYKQVFKDESVSDSTIFFTSLAPIRLSQQIDEGNLIIWQNYRPSSTRFCRPIKIQFARETRELTLAEKQNLDRQLEDLIPFECTIDNINILVNFDLHLTMIDRKVGNVLTENNSTQKCFICGASSKEFNNIDVVLKRPVINADYLKLGLSTLHAWIRFFESLLHLAYKLDIKKWQARSVEDKQKVQDSKKRIQQQLRLQLGLIVDKPKPGFGSSNDGNTARKFFENASVVAEICRIDKQLIHRFHIILQTLSSGYDIEIAKFQCYAIETARIFANLYSWYPMPTSVHRTLIHGAETISAFEIPIGQLSEEAQEARNKDIKSFRLNFVRKTSRQDNLQDIFNRLLVSSDPIISGFRQTLPKASKSLLPDALNLLKQPKVCKMSLNLCEILSSSDED